MSYRRYLFGEGRTPGEYVTVFDIESTGDKEYKISWTGKTEGVMDVTVEGDKLKRSRSYFSEEETYQTMAWVDPDTVVFHTSYDGTAYREEIRFLDNNHRLRQTVGRDLDTGIITLVGQYFEVRK